MTNTRTTIEWTDATWSPVTGCTKVSAGCGNCTAEALAPRMFAGQRTPFTDEEIRSGDAYASTRRRRFTDVRCHDDRLDKPLRWRKPRRVFVNSMSDLFHEDVPDEFLDRVFAVMALAKDHTFQVLTKRAERMRDYCRTLGKHNSVDRVSLASQAFDSDGEFVWHLSAGGWHLPNVWLGVSVEDQPTANERIPLLLDTPAAVRFVSAEPLLASVDLLRCSAISRTDVGDYGFVDWIIVGGESGPKARPCDVAWIRSIVEQCKAAGVPCFVKQIQTFRCPTCRNCWTDMPEWPAEECDVCTERAKRVTSGDPSEWPEDLRVREWPK